MSEQASSGGFLRAIFAFLGKLVNFGLGKNRPKSLVEADEMAKLLVNRWALVTGLVSWVPGSTFMLMGMDYQMYNDIAKVYGVNTFNIDAVKASIATTITGRAIVEIVLSLIAPIGWIIKAVIAAGVTKTAGSVMMSYMSDRSPIK